MQLDFSREPPERSRMRSGGGVRAGMHRGKPLIPQSRDDTTREPAPNGQPEHPVGVRRRALPAHMPRSAGRVADAMDGRPRVSAAGGAWRRGKFA